MLRLLVSMLVSVWFLRSLWFGGHVGFGVVAVHCGFCFGECFFCFFCFFAFAAIILHLLVLL